MTGRLATRKGFLTLQSRTASHMPRPADPNAKEALVTAARAEFARRGLRGARIEDITAACGLSKGTAFEGTIWEIADAEVNRVREDFQRYQGHGVCRPDIPGELFGSLIVGTYLLLAVRMSRLQEKPDLREWARSLHTLIHEGSQPR